MTSKHDLVRGRYQRIYVHELQREWEFAGGLEDEDLWPYFPGDDDESDDDGDDTSMYYHCPCCGAKASEDDRQRGVKVAYPCGGVYLKTTDEEGVACWEGRCGAAQLKQLPLKMEEDCDA